MCEFKTEILRYLIRKNLFDTGIDFNINIRRLHLVLIIIIKIIM